MINVNKKFVFACFFSQLFDMLNNVYIRTYAYSRFWLQHQTCPIFWQNVLLSAYILYGRNKTVRHIFNIYIPRPSKSLNLNFYAALSLTSLWIFLRNQFHRLPCAFVLVTFHRYVSLRWNIYIILGNKCVNKMITCL